MTPVDLPPGWVERVSAYPADGGPSGAEWVRTVPRLVDEALERWDLAPDGPPRTGWTALVLPVRRGDEPLALKVVWPHPEAVHEALALRTWDGAGAVRLVAARPSGGQLLLERLDADADLTGGWDEEACAVIGGLLRRLHVPAPPRLPRLAEYLAPHLERMASRPAVPRRVVDRTRGLARDLLEGAVPEALLHTDLHYENVLRRADGAWTAIDPKPVAGHPGFDLWPALRNRLPEMGTGAALRWSVRRRLTVLAEAAGLDEDEARAWTLLRAGVEVSWASVVEGEDGLTACVALHKALDG
ncbi:aminoglycoside phosphotransferase family protein [Phycicoccus sp.]|uniref:aminoglycoside phosphotransferase family protein n=1 Tax=Phycicoccus sp. TaxID=1902410 RepID=UPI002CA378B4|nr:aminoglycoside phosphotransferase family protein [Phycicoccus sp.]HMM95656.1 aminoglycoside phosphotransferase family protein [Phycicoccus sp.]